VSRSVNQVRIPKVTGSTPSIVHSRDSSGDPTLDHPVVIAMSSQAREKLFLKGVSETRYGEYALESLGGTAAGALCVGSQPGSISLAAKGNPDFPNEDALLVIREGALTLFAVADSHFGVEASHESLARINRFSNPLPRNLEDLYGLLDRIPFEVPGIPDRSSTTLLVGVHDSDTHRGFGVSYGDSSLWILDVDGHVGIVNELNVHYVTPYSPVSFSMENRRPFEYHVAIQGLVCAFTDGVNECHYGRPETSIGAEHLRRLMTPANLDPTQFVRSLMELALTGVDGNPGGEDNIAIVAFIA